MRRKKSWFRMSGILIVLAVALMLPAQAVAASKYKVLHKFTGGADGGLPYAGLTFDTDGNLYGTTAGTVYKLTPNADGTWTESVLDRLRGASYADLIFDSTGNLYGTTADGGASDTGTVYKLAPNADGSWTESVLHSFCNNCADAYPNAGVIFDSVGNLYGTTAGVAGGAVYKLTPNADGSWTESVLDRLPGPSYAGLIFDGEGNLYGTGGAGVFELTPNADGTWTESVLHRFTGADGSDPLAGLIFDAAGNLYGTTYYGGAVDWGVVFKLTPHSNGSWTESVLHSFADHPGANPFAGLAFDLAGNLYGTASDEESANDGVVFKLTPHSNGGWAYSALHVFAGKPARHPLGRVILDKAGNVYGTTHE